MSKHGASERMAKESKLKIERANSTLRVTYPNKSHDVSLHCRSNDLADKVEALLWRLERRDEAKKKKIARLEK